MDFVEVAFWEVFRKIYKGKEIKFLYLKLPSKMSFIYLFPVQLNVGFVKKQLRSQ